jgi:hypothetical protein
MVTLGTILLWTVGGSNPCAPTLNRGVATNDSTARKVASPGWLPGEVSPSPLRPLDAALGLTC